MTIHRKTNRRWARKLERAIKELSPSSLVAAVEAASVSPAQCHRLHALMSLFGVAVASAQATGKAVRPDDYARLMELSANQATRAGVPEPEEYDHALASVWVEWASDTFRFLPGAGTSHAVEFEVLETLCSVIDPVLVDELGYGLGDVVELVLRRIDHVVSTLAKAWPHDPATVDLVTSEEIEAAASLSGFSALASKCLYPDRAFKALEKFTAPVDVLATVDRDTFGAPIGVWSGIDPDDSSVPLPAGYLMVSLHKIAKDLLFTATSNSDDVDMAAEQAIGKMVFDEMRRLGHPMQGVITLEEDYRLVVHLVAKYENLGVLFVDVGVASGTEALMLRAALGTASVHKIAGGDNYCPIGFDPDELAGMDLMCVQALYGTGKRAETARVGPESVDVHVFLTLLRCLDQPEDLWHVLKEKEKLEQATGESVPSLFATWRLWKDYGKRVPLFAEDIAGNLGEAPSETGVPGETLANNARFADVEAALAKFDLPELSTWPNVFAGNETVGLVDPQTGTFVFVLRWTVPVIVDASRFLAEGTPEGYTWELGTVISMRLPSVQEAFVAAARDCDLDALCVKVIRDPSGETPIRTVERTSSTVVIGWNDECPAVHAEDPVFVDMLIGHALADHFGSSKTSKAFFQKWKETG